MGGEKYHFLLVNKVSCVKGSQKLEKYFISRKEVEIHEEKTLGFG